MDYEIPSYTSVSVAATSLPGTTMMDRSGKRVCVIGAGPSGLTTIKQCRDEGLEVVCFERFSGLGGLWYYKEEVKNGITSIARNTVSNTSKEFSGFSDFPPPKNFPNFLPHPLMLEYFRMYANKFELEQYIIYNKKVTCVTYASDHDEMGRWSVTVEDVNSGERQTQIFDGVCVCSGHHVLPMLPEFPGQGKFRGHIQHTHTFKHADGMMGKRVAVIGIGNSGGDAACDVAAVASAVYLSTRRGAWVRPKFLAFGLPADNYMATRAMGFVSNYLPTSVSNFMWETVLNFIMDHDKYGLTPTHRFLSQHPMVNDFLTSYILNGKITVKRNVSEFTESGIIFEGETEVTELDQVILATGYKWTIPFIDPSIVDFSNNQMSLFKNMFQPNLSHPHTLALIGLCQPTGPLYVVGEMQARWYARLMKGLVKLPSRHQMLDTVKQDHELMQGIYYQSPRHTLEVLYMPYLDFVAEEIGCKPSLSKYMYKDPRLFYHLIFGLFTTYQYRLEGPFSWSGARNAIVNVNERIKAGFVENTPLIVIPK